MDIESALKEIEEGVLRTELTEFLKHFTNPAFGALPKREIELHVFNLMRNLGVIKADSSIYRLMTDLMITRAKASQLIFDFEIRRHGSDEQKLDELVKQALIDTKFAKDGDYFVMEIDNPLTLAHMRQKIREAKHLSDTSFNSALVRAPLEAIVNLILVLHPDKKQHQNIKDALIKAGAPDGSVKGVIKGALKTLGSKVIGEAADQFAEGLVDKSTELLGPLVNASATGIHKSWRGIFDEAPKGD